MAGMFGRIRTHLATRPAKRTIIHGLAIALLFVMAGNVCVTFVQKPLQAEPIRKTFEIALIGDAPYTPSEESQYPNVIADINRSPIAFVIHDGDIQSSGTPCTNELLLKRRSLYQTIRHPFVYLPGDNEWTDCHKTGSNPLERLAKLRELFLAERSFNQASLKLERQSRLPQFVAYRENVRWVYGPVLFVGLHIVGSNNNLGRTPEMDQEFQARNKANLQWLQSSFALARDRQVSGVMIIIQANPGFELPRDQRTGFNDFLDLLQTETLQFKKPVALVHGDSHYFRIDKPMVNPQNQRVMNFTRVETFGPPDMHWVKGIIEPNTPNFFRFQPMTVQANIQ